MMRKTFSSTLFLILLAAQPSFANTLSDADGNYYVSADKPVRIAIIHGISLGSQLQSRFIANIAVHQQATFKLLEKYEPSKNGENDLEIAIHCSEVCGEEAVTLGFVRLTAEETFNFIEKFYATKENRQIKIRDALLIAFLNHQGILPQELEHYVAYLRAGKTPEAWEKVKIVEIPGKKPYEISPHLFR